MLPCWRDSWSPRAQYLHWWNLWGCSHHGDLRDPECNQWCSWQRRYEHKTCVPGTLRRKELVFTTRLVWTTPHEGRKEGIGFYYQIGLNYPTWRKEGRNCFLLPDWFELPHMKEGRKELVFTTRLVWTTPHEGRKEGIGFYYQISLNYPTWRKEGRNWFLLPDWFELPHMKEGRKKLVFTTRLVWTTPHEGRKEETI